MAAGSGAGWGVFFFFSSRRRHTRLQGDWSSDVCSSDLIETALLLQGDAEIIQGQRKIGIEVQGLAIPPDGLRALPLRQRRIAEIVRSEERRVGKECRSRWSPYH